jgi:hypothetical protein
MTELFDTAVTSLLHLPEVLDRLAAADGDRRSAGHHAAHGHGHGRIHGLGGGGGGGGGAPMDIVESPREYAFVLDVPGLSKSDIQVPHLPPAARGPFTPLGPGRQQLTPTASACVSGDTGGGPDASDEGRQREAEARRGGGHERRRVPIHPVGARRGAEVVRAQVLAAGGLCGESG